MVRPKHRIHFHFRCRSSSSVSRIMKKQKQAPLPPAAAGTVLPEEPSSMKPGMVSTPAAAGPSSKATGQQPPALPPKPDGIANSPFNPRNWKMASDFLGAATGPGGLLGPSLAQNQNRLRDEPVQQGLRPTSTPTSNPTTSSTSAICMCCCYPYLGPYSDIVYHTQHTTSIWRLKHASKSRATSSKTVRPCTRSRKR